MANAGLTIKIELVNPEEVRKIEGLGERFEKVMEKTFADLVFETHKYLIRITPIDTGELRGGWTAWLEKNQVDYSRQLFDLSIAEKAPGREYHLDVDAIEQGKAESTFEAPSPFDITIINEVPYGQYVDDGTSRFLGIHFVDLARFKAEDMAERIFKNWIDKINEHQDIVEPDQPEEPAA